MIPQFQSLSVTQFNAGLTWINSAVTQATRADNQIAGISASFQSAAAPLVQQAFDSMADDQTTETTAVGGADVALASVLGVGLSGWAGTVGALLQQGDNGSDPPADKPILDTPSVADLIKSLNAPSKYSDYLQNKLFPNSELTVEKDGSFTIQNSLGSFIGTPKSDQDPTANLIQSLWKNFTVPDIVTGGYDILTGNPANVIQKFANAAGDAFNQSYDVQKQFDFSLDSPLAGTVADLAILGGLGYSAMKLTGMDGPQELWKLFESKQVPIGSFSFDIPDVASGKISLSLRGNAKAEADLQQGTFGGLLQSLGDMSLGAVVQGTTASGGSYQFGITTNPKNAPGQTGHTYFNITGSFGIGPAK